MTQRDAKKLLNASKEARLLLRTGICKNERDAVVKALCQTFGKASAENIEVVLASLSTP